MLCILHFLLKDLYSFTVQYIGRKFLFVHSQVQSSIMTPKSYSKDCLYSHTSRGIFQLTNTWIIICFRINLNFSSLVMSCLISFSCSFPKSQAIDTPFFQSCLFLWFYRSGSLIAFLWFYLSEGGNPHRYISHNRPPCYSLFCFQAR